MMKSQSSSVTSAAGLRRFTPATFTSVSIRPCLATTSATQVTICAFCATSHPQPEALALGFRGNLAGGRLRNGRFATSDDHGRPRSQKPSAALGRSRACRRNENDLPCDAKTTNRTSGTFKTE